MRTITVISVILAFSAITRTFGYNHGPKYDFEYSVHDPHTGDKKQQHEHNDGQLVKGLYSFKEADGTVRVVEYEAGPQGGFNAIVKRLGHAHHPQHYGKEGHEQGDAYSHIGTTHFGYHY